MREPIAFGGVLNTSSAGLSAVSRAQTNGARKNNSTSVRRACDRNARSGLLCRRRPTPSTVAAAGRVRTSVVIVDPPLLEEELQGRDDHDDREEEPGDGRRLAHLELLESDPVEVQDQRLGADPGSAAGQNVRLDEDLERSDERERHREE